MARINLALDQDEVLGLLTDGGGDAFRLLLQEMLNEVLREKSAEQLCAQPYEQTQQRTDTATTRRRQGPSRPGSPPSS